MDVEESFLHCADIREALRPLGATALARPEGLAYTRPRCSNHARINTMTVEALDQRLQDGYRKNLY